MANPAPTVKLHPSAPVRTLPRPSGFKSICVSVGLHRHAIRLLTRENLLDTVSATTQQPGFAVFPKTHTDHEYPSILSITGSSGSEDFEILGLSATFPQIDILPNNEVLVVAPRCQRFQDGTHELNAKVYDRTGTLKREFLLGDGIEHVQIDAPGNIWVGYFDEGVYGNFGWPIGGTIGAAGLSCFSATGQKLWDFSPPEGFDYISDCYALNVSLDGVWAYYYTGFPFVRIDANLEMRCWENEFIGGAHTLAVEGNQVLLYGGYGDKKTNCYWLRLADQSAELIADVSLALPGNVDLAQARVIGRNDELHVFSGDDWYRFSVNSLPSALKEN